MLSAWTRDEIEHWLRELAVECDHADWQHVYKEGFAMALVAVIGKMDADIRRAAAQK